MTSLIFDKYEVLKRLAVGGMGEIFLARQHGVAGFDRLAILKSLLPDLAESTEAVDQFLDEARVAATLNHPNIVSIYEVGKWDGVYFIAMEYIEGENVGILLKTVREQAQRLPFSVAGRIVHDSALGLDHAHKARSATGRQLSIVHRDVSPQNIMVRVDGVSKVVDFGVAKAANRSTRTATGVLKGKIRYMPPEQLNGLPMDGRSDQFSLGVVFWEMLAGQRLFAKSDDELATIRAMLRDPILPPSSAFAMVPKELDAIVMRMLEKNPADRYASCRDVAVELHRWLERGAHDSQEQVIKVVNDTLGSRIQSKTSDLSPSKENFFINLSERTEVSDDREPETRRTPAPAPSGSMPVVAPPPPKSKLLPFIAAGTVLALFGGVLFGLNSRNTPVQAVLPAPSETAAIEIAEPEHAAITIDGKVIDSKSPVRVEPIDPGPHVVRIELAGHEPIERRVSVRAGEAIVLRESLRVLPAMLSVESTPAGATVTAGSFLLGTTPLEVKTLSAGVRHELTIAHADFVTQKTFVELVPGETKKVNVTLQRAALAVLEVTPPVQKTRPRPKAETVQATERPNEQPAVFASEGYLTIKTTPWTKVTIAGAPYGATPVFKLRLPAGKHMVQLTNETEGIDATRVVQIKGGETTKLDLMLEK